MYYLLTAKLNDSYDINVTLDNKFENDQTLTDAVCTLLADCCLEDLSIYVDNFESLHVTIHSMLIDIFTYISIDDYADIISTATNRDYYLFEDKGDAMAFLFSQCRYLIDSNPAEYEYVLENHRQLYDQFCKEINALRLKYIKECDPDAVATNH